eukprot:gene11047-12212_t
MEEILSQMSFDEGIAMPIANEENKQLEAELERKQKELVKVQEDVTLYSDRIHSMSDHLKNVRQELQQTQELCNARKREISSEDHLKQVAEREQGRLNAEIKRINNEINTLKERRNMYENNLFKGTELLEQTKNQMKWDQKALEAWLEESSRRDEDAMTLQKFTRADESKIKELSLKQQKMTDERAAKRNALEHEITQTLTAQLEMDKTAEAFRKNHMERQELLHQWESTIKQMQRRDHEMDLAALNLAELKVEVRHKEETLKEREQFLENEVANNQEKEKKISIAERQAAKLRLDYQNSENARILFQDELQTLTYTVDRTGKDLEAMREKFASLKKEVADKQEKLARAQKTRENLHEQLKMVADTTLSAEDRAYRLEEALKSDEMRIHEIEKELNRLREKQFRKTEELYQVKQIETNTIAEIQGAKAANRNLSSKLNKLDQDSLKQQEIIYNQDFQLQTVERKIARLQGERSNDEKSQLEERVKELSAVYDEHNSTHSLLTSQLKNLSDDIRRVNREQTKGKGEKDSLTSKIEELNLHNTNSERELKKIISKKEGLMVDENILKLQIKRLRDQLNSKAGNVLSLEKQRLQLETTMKERSREIGIHMDMLRAQLKAAEEEKQTISSELHERITKIDKLRKRYEILMVSMAPPEGEEEKSQAYYVIKAAQEKEELQRHGDELDAKIRKSEKEIRALENTLKLMNNRNETYRKSFSKVEQSSDEYAERQKLEEQLRATMDKYKYKRRQIKELQDDYQTMERTLQSLMNQEQSLMQVYENKTHQVVSLKKELQDQEQKQERVNTQLAKLMQSVRNARNVKHELPEEKDIQLRELRDFNTSMMKQLGSVVHDNPEITAAVHLYFTQAGLPMPPSPGPGQTSRPSSVRSSVSSLASFRSQSTAKSKSSRQGLGTTSVNVGAFAAADIKSPTGSARGPTGRSLKPGTSRDSPVTKKDSRPGSASSQASRKSQTSGRSNSRGGEEERMTDGEKRERQER